MAYFKKDTVIIGAGLTGLTSAFYLNKRNRSFFVLEKADHVGGVIRTRMNGDFMYEEGPNTGIIGTPDIASLFEDIKENCRIIEANNSVSKRYILKNKQWHSLPSGPLGGITTPLFSLKDKFSLLCEPFRKPGSDPDESLAGLVVRRMGKSFLDYAIDPFILGVYAGDPAYLVTKYAFPKLYNLEQNYGSFIGGAIKKKFEKKPVHEKKVTRKVFSTEKGLGGLTDTLYKLAGTNNFLLECQDIGVTADGKERYRITFRHNNREHIVYAKHVITTVPAYELKHILNFQEKDLLEKVSTVRYAPVVQVALGFRKWQGQPLDAFGGLIPFKENIPLLGILFMSSLFSGRAPSGGAMLSVFMGGIRNPDMVNKTDAEITSVLEKILPSLLKTEGFNPDFMKIMRYRNAIPQYGIDSKDRFNATEKLSDIYPGLYIGGNLRDGIGMADRVKQGKYFADATNIKT
ncbi:MAG: protoporphyrinogen oxidase [Chlorobi bacterium]|nr:protoporphyrinogen oxidase [Chlorobiota bacterium]